MSYGFPHLVGRGPPANAPTSEGLYNALDTELSSLGQAVQQDAESEIWRLGWHALYWLYSFEEWSNGQDPGYYDHRNASDAGRCAAALVWARGLLQHNGLELGSLQWRPAPTLVLTEDGWKPSTWMPTLVASRSWPAREGLPRPTRHAHGRDAWYDTYVAHKPFLEPLQAARRFFANERPERSP